VANKVAIIDHGKIVVQGSPEDLKKQTNTQSLEETFLALTGRAIREEEASGSERMRIHRRMGRN